MYETMIAAAGSAETETGRDARRPESERPYPARKRDDGIKLRLDANEGRPGARALAELARAAADADEARLYPDATPLEEAVARRWDTDPARVVACAGSDDAMARVVSVFLSGGTKALDFAPGFEMFTRYARLRGAEPVSLPWGDGAFPLAEATELVARCTSLRLVYLASPNNPTGREAGRKTVLSLAEACALARKPLLFDAAYAEFADDDPSAALVESGTAYVLRTFSKAYGLAGLRVGYVVAPSPREADAVRAAGSPYPVSNAGARAALAALADSEALAETVAAVAGERDALSRLLAGLGARVTDSRANFVLARVAEPAALAAFLAERGIAVRTFPGRPGLADAVRVSCPCSATGMAVLETALRAFGSPS